METGITANELRLVVKLIEVTLDSMTKEAQPIYIRLHMKLAKKVAQMEDEHVDAL